MLLLLSMSSILVPILPNEMFEKPRCFFNLYRECGPSGGSFFHVPVDASLIQGDDIGRHRVREFAPGHAPQASLMKSLCQIYTQLLTRRGVTQWCGGEQAALANVSLR